MKYEELVDLLMKAYASEGYKKGRNGVKDLLKALMNKNIITHASGIYQFNQEILSTDD